MSSTSGGSSKRKSISVQRKIKMKKFGVIDTQCYKLREPINCTLIMVMMAIIEQRLCFWAAH